MSDRDQEHLLKCQEIVRELAQEMPSSYGPRECGCCGEYGAAESHDPSCLWRRAREMFPQ
jgi:hypothetical protein